MLATIYNSAFLSINKNLQKEPSDKYFGPGPQKNLSHGPDQPLAPGAMALALGPGPWEVSMGEDSRNVTLPYSLMMKGGST